MTWPEQTIAGIELNAGRRRSGRRRRAPAASGGSTRSPLRTLRRAAPTATHRDARSRADLRGSEPRGDRTSPHADGPRAQRPPGRGALRRRAGPARATPTPRRPAAGLGAEPRRGPAVHRRRPAGGDRAQVRRRPLAHRPRPGHARHQPRPDARRRAGHGEVAALRAARRRRPRRLDAHHPGRRRHHRGPDQVRLELRPARRRGPVRAVAGAGAGPARHAARARSSASRRSPAARSRSRTRCCRSSPTG